MNIRPYRWLPLLSAGLPLLAVALLPAPAQATCGDYVIVGNAQASHQTPMPGEPSSNPGKPCHGPSCQRHHDAPLAPTAPAPAPTNDWIVAISTVERLPDAGSGWAVLSSSSTSVSRPTDIFHPPKRVRA